MAVYKGTEDFSDATVVLPVPVDVSDTLSWTGDNDWQGVADFSAATLTLPTEGVVTAAIADAAVTPVKQNITPRVNVAGDNVVIATTDRAILFSSDGGGAATIDASGMLDGQCVWLTMSTFDTDAYTCANVNGSSTLTFNATGETALLYFDGTLLHAFLAGATLV